MAWYCPRCGHEADAAGQCPRDDVELARVSSHDLLGRRVGEYTVLASLGGGAFGTVYRAVHARSGMIAAIKLLHRPIDHAESQRVVVEGRAAAMLDHPNVVKVYDLALTSDRRPYIVMEYLEGRALAKLVPQGLSVAAAVAIAGDVLAGLAAAHARGIVHRDLKPDNIFVAADRTLVVDFGLAKLVADPGAPALTMTGEAIGTPAYMAPEQIRGKQADGRADLYALGCVLFEMLCGHPPYEAPSTFVLFDAHLEKPVPPVTRADCPPHVAAAIAKALAKDPADRFPDARAMWRALSRPARTRRRGTIVVAGAGVIVALVVAGVAASASESPTTPAATPPTTIPPAAPKVATPAPAVTNTDDGQPYVATPNADPPMDPNLVRALAAFEASLDRGDLTRIAAIKARCAIAKSPVTLQTRAYVRRYGELIDAHFPGIDLARDCASPPAKPRRIPLPPAYADEPPLDASLLDSLEVIHEQLDTGHLQRPQVVTLLCAMYQMKHDHAVFPAVRAYYRRYETLLRGYFPDLDAAECR